MSHMRRKTLHCHIPCDCARCRGLATADPVWGFDTSLVPAVRCMVCGQVIGDEPYELDAVLARFGQVFFMHSRCAPRKNTEVPQCPPR